MCEETKRTLYVGNLDPAANEDLIIALFSTIGQVKGCKMIGQGSSDPYCFVEFVDGRAALTAMATMDGRRLLEREMKVNWATPGSQQRKVNTSQHFHVFVGDLGFELDVPALRDAFTPFGEVSDCRVIRDPETQASKGSGFVSFVKKMEAENAIISMNGQELEGRPIRTAWASRKPSAIKGSPNARPRSYQEIFNQAAPSSRLVFLGGVTTGLTQELVMNIFSPFGVILDIRVFCDKGYAFIRFSSKESAASAIFCVDNTVVNGRQVTCSWGRASSTFDQTKAATDRAGPVPLPVTGAQYPYCSFGQTSGLPIQWHPQTQGPMAMASPDQWHPQTQGPMAMTSPDQRRPQTQGYPVAAQTHGYPVSAQTQGYSATAQMQDIQYGYQPGYQQDFGGT